MEEGMSNIRDGDVYKTIDVENKSFEIKYGYYEEFERLSSEPVPIYPDFISRPIYTDNGTPFVTAMQQTCDHFEGGDSEIGCYSCRYFSECEDLIGLCHHKEKRLKE